MTYADLITDDIDTKSLAITLLREHKDLNASNKSLKDDIVHLKSENERLSLILSKLKRSKFGSSSEKGDNKNNGNGVFDEMDTTGAEVDLDLEDEVITVPEHTRKKGRKGLPKDLPRIIIEHDLTEEEKQCPCGCTLEKIREETSEQLDYTPASLRILVHIKPTYACKTNNMTIRTAKLPPQPIPKSIATPGLLAHIMVSKYRDHLPLYRQEQIWSAMGINLPRCMLSNWMIKVGTLILPLINLLKDKLRETDYIQADETFVQVLKEKDKKATSKSVIWLYKTGVDEKGIAIYEYQPNRKAENATEFLEDFSGFLQVDGYSGYNELASKENITRVSCWAHARRKFIDITKPSKNGKAQTAVNFIQKLYKIEKQIKTLDDVEKLKIRQEKSKPVIERLMIWLKDLYPYCPPKSSIATAINYTLEREQELKVYLEHGFLNIDNNLAENKIRPFAIGRKNWLFMGNADGAKTSSNIYSLLETAKMNGHNIYNYFKYILEKIPLAKTCDDLEDLLPMNLKPELIKPPPDPVK